MTRRLLRLLTALCLSLMGLLLLTGSAGHDEAEYHRQREALAEDNFSTVMGNNDWSRVQAQRPTPRPASASGSLGGHIAGDSPEVVVPLPRYESLRSRALELAEASARPEAPLVILGSSSYRGQALDGALALTLELGVTLGAEGLWKTVPLVGEEVVVVSARQKGQPEDLPLSRLAGYHVWLTPQAGEVTLELELLVPSQGRRGSLEYDFLVAKTPVTRFECDFPTPDLDPRLRAAVRSETHPTAEGVRLSASLEPSSRIHLVGFEAVGEDEGRQARVYAESLHLASVDEGGMDLFTVLRFNILYAGEQRFEVLVPEGMSVVSADGQGAFRYTTEPHEGGTLLRGETAFPIRDEYEISLRLHRELARDGEAFELALPRCQGVEREYGWLGVEVVGNLRLEEADRRGVLAVDTRQLPWEMVQSAVSPILRAYRFHSADAAVHLDAQRLPEQEPATGSVDRIQATTTVSREGAVLTDLRIELRNRLRHSLAMRLPEGTSVRSAHLDGEPAKPGVAEDGTLLFPLRRSAGGHDLVAFTLQVVLESEPGRLGLLGRPRFELPAVGLPASTVQWELYLPANNAYSALEGALEPQVYAGAGRWFQGGVAPGADGGAPMVQAVTEELTQSAGTGAMPVRIELPTEGKRLAATRYWLEADEAMSVSCWHMRGWLRGPVILLCVGLLAGCVLLAGLEGTRGPWPRRIVGTGLGLCFAGTLYALGSGGVIPALLLGGAAVALQRRVHRRAWAGARSLLGQLQRPTEDPSAQPDSEASASSAWASAGPVGQLVLLAGAGFTLLFTAITLLRVLVVLG
jgi:hypothetical protein